MSRWLPFVILTVLSWGTYIPTLHKGQLALSGSGVPAFLMVGLAYVLVAIAVISGPVFSWAIAPLIASPSKIFAQGGNAQLVTDFGENQARYERLGETEKKRAQMLGAIQTVHIVRWAGAESVAIYGLIGLFTGVMSLYGAWGFIAASVILLLLLRPDYETELEKIPS